MSRASCDMAAAALERFERYHPPADRASDAVWPPAIRPLAWNGNPRDIRTNAIHYDRAETEALMVRMLELQLPRRRAFVSDLYSGLTCLLWGELFERVGTFSIRPSQVPAVHHGRFSIWFGRIGDMPFMYNALASFRPVDFLAIDGTVRYDLVMILYFTIRRIMPPGGLIAFFNTRQVGPGNDIPRFLDDLSRGAIDGIDHHLDPLPAFPGGVGVTCEVVI